MMPQMMSNLVSVTTKCDRPRNSMQVTLEFDEDFEGFLYPKGFYNRPECRKRGYHSNQVTLNLRLDGSCGVLETGTNADLKYSVTVVVMMEADWEILQMMDSAYTVHCRFTPDKDFILQSGITVPMIGVTDLPITVPPLPECRMQIVQGTDPRAHTTRELTLGELASMVFYLNTNGPSEGFDLLVYNCLTTSGHNSRQINLLDENGCPVQQKIIGHVYYDRGHIRPRETLAYAIFKVFKFPEVPNVYFECQCRVCLDSCDRPICPGLDPGLQGSRTSYIPARRKKRQIPEANGLEQLLADPQSGLVVPGEPPHKVDTTIVAVEVVSPRLPTAQARSGGGAAGAGGSGDRGRGTAAGDGREDYDVDGFVPLETFIVVLSLLGLLLLLSLLLVCLLLLRSRRRASKEKDAARAYSPYSGPGGYSDMHRY